MKTKTVATKGNNPSTTEVGANYIEETLKLVESEEVREHLLKWLTSGSVRNPVKICAEIVYLAPIPIDQKLAMLQGLLKYEDLKHPKIPSYIREIQNANKERNINPDGHNYYLFLNSSNESHLEFDSFSDAVEHIQSLNAQADSDTNDLSYYKSLKFWDIDNQVLRTKFARKQVVDDSMNTSDLNWITLCLNTNISYRITKYIPDAKYEDEGTELSWFLNEDGEIVYSDGDIDVPTYLNVPMPFQPGDIVITEGKPFTEERKVLILENNDTFNSVDSHGVTCLYKNIHGNYDVGLFKFYDFQIDSKCCVPALYRAKTYAGEVSDGEVNYVFDSASKAIKKNPALGREIYNRLNSFQMLNSSFVSYNSNGTRSAIHYHGISGDCLKQGFGL